MITSGAVYLDTLTKVISKLKETTFVEKFLEQLIILKKNKNTLFIIGNGGSAGNAQHIANDFTYGATAGTNEAEGFSVNALSSNQSVITCLANDLGYDEIYLQQLKASAVKGDILLALSGSGNSKNIVKAVEYANVNSITTFSVVGYDGGDLKKISNHILHIEENDMQIAEDVQLIIGHLCMKELNNYYKKL